MARDTALGCTFFHADNEPRPQSRLIQGKPLRAWQEANRGLLEAALSQLRSLGWQIVE